MQFQDSTAFESRDQHAVNKLLLTKAGPTVVKSTGWQLTGTHLLQPALITEQIAASELATLAESAVPYVHRTDQSDSYSCRSVARETTYVSEEINLAVSV